MSSRVEKNGRVPRRCLGPWRVEHSFLSDDPNNRICGACRQRQTQVLRSVSARMYEPVATTDPGR